MKKDIKRMILLALTGIFFLSFVVSCVTFEKIGKKVDQGIGWSKGEPETAPTASQAAPGNQSQEQASLAHKGAGVTQPAQPSQDQVKPMTKEESEKYFVHQVKWPNESLSIIAKWYTGSLMNWKFLARANPEMNPTVIHKDDRVRIPVNMLKTRDPMPEAFVEDLVQNLKKEKPAKGSEGGQKEEEPALFGPKGLKGE
jgi:hypothetical protein